MSSALSSPVLDVGTHQAPDDSGEQPFGAIILAGGSGSRLGGVDKSGLDVAGRTMLERVLAACASADETVVVGHPRPTSRPVSWALEDPPGGGPLAGLHAGLTALGAGAGTVVVLASDMPFVTDGDVNSLLTALDGYEAAMFFDGEGVRQPLAAAYEIEPLRRHIAAMGNVAHQAVRRVVAGMRTAAVPNASAARDCDTPLQLRAAQPELA